MLKLYYARPSLFARPVWLALLEKQLPVELVPVDLSGAQFEPDFLALNPFGHVPVLVDGDFRVVESLAILDYLEAKYPAVSLLPTYPEALAKVRMVQLVTVNELIGAIAKLLMEPADSEDWHYGRLRSLNVMEFFEQMLGDGPFFAGAQLTIAEVVAGSVVHRLPDLGVPLADYPKMQDWSARLLARSTWQAIQLSDEEWAQFKRRLRLLPKVWHKRRQKQMRVLLQT